MAQDKKVVLIVDDSPMITQVVASVIAGMGHHAVEASDGQSALITAETLPPDLVFLDLHMPEMNGLQMLERMRSDPNLAKVPVVILTSSRDTETMAKVARFGVSDYISKPARPNRIREKVKKYL